MSNQRMSELLVSCIEYIIEMLGDREDSYDVLTNAVGFTETELDTLVWGITDPTDDDDEEE